MGNEKVIIDIGKGGAVTVSVEGAKGDSCSLLSAGIIKALGDVTSDTPTAEMDERPVEQAQEVYAQVSGATQNDGRLGHRLHSLSSQVSPK